MTKQAAAKAKIPDKPFFVSGPVDFLMISGLSLITFFSLLPLQKAVGMAAVYQLTAFLAIVGNWPHFAATNWRLYHSRDNYSQYPLTAFAVPALMVLVAIASFVSPTGVAPYFVKIYMLWSPYHFAGQTMGLTAVYARRSGFLLGRNERLALSGFVFGSFAFLNISADIGHAQRSFFGINYPRLGLPPVTETIAGVIMYACGAAFIAMIIKHCVQSKKMVPPIVLLPAITQFIWFVPGSRLPQFYEFVPFFHSVQYLLIAWSMQLKERMDSKGITPSPAYAWKESIRWYAAVLFLGYVLFKLGPQLASTLGYNINFTAPIFITAVSLHHFFVDGVIWKLRNPQVASPLLVNIEQFTKTPAKNAAGSLS